MANAHTRRNFLCSAPLAAAAAALGGTEIAMEAQTTETTSPVPFKLIGASQIAEAKKTLGAKPGNFNVFDSPSLPFTVVLTTEEKKSAKEFEWHEGRDHVLEVLEGTTVYEVGGTPQNGRNTKPGEWLAPASQGATTLTLHKGDVLVIPRGTPHKRSTESSVTFYLISTTGKA